MSNPAILWAQDRDKIYITIEVNKLDLQNLKIEGRNILVDGLEGDNNPREEFNFNLLLYSDVNPETVEREVRNASLFLTLDKTTRQFWNRLTQTKQNNVKIDWQKWVMEEDEDDTEEEELIQNFNDFKKTLPSELLETDFTELLPDEGRDLNEEELITSAGEEAEVESVNEDKDNNNIDGSVDSIDSGFLANGEESNTETSTELDKEILIENGDETNLVLDELDVEKLDEDLKGELNN